MSRDKKTEEAHKLRQKNQEYYDSHNVEPTEVDGIVFRSRLEAQWYEEFAACDSLKCVECIKVPLWIDGSYGRFLSNYTPDLHFELNDGTRIFVELKPTHDLAVTDDRQKRALELNPKYKFIVIGGYTYQGRGVTVRLMTGKTEKIYKNVSVPEVLKFLGCGGS